MEFTRIQNKLLCSQAEKRATRVACYVATLLGYICLSVIRSLFHRVIRMGNLLKRSNSVFGRFSKCGFAWKGDKRKVVVITGCDSGLGYSLSLRCHQLGLTVVSGCLDLGSEGAQALNTKCYVYDLDVTESASVFAFLEKVNKITEENGYELHAVINNAGVMIFGEFEWYTERQMVQQVEVNMIGSFRMAKTFLPLLRKHKGRLINITSHCALTNLPSLSVYGATKAGIQSWSDGLRMEQIKYGVKVISFIPGSFISQSNIMAKQQFYSEEMESCFSPEGKELYGRYFKDFNLYLRHVCASRKPLAPLADEKLYQKFAEALLHKNPSSAYKHQPWRYFFYYNAFRLAPYRLRDYLMTLFMKFPEFK